jgi:uncharacterized iron-regulated membrane protein
MRRAWFQVHKWIGLVLAILIIPLSLTGAALVWDDALDHGLNPQRYAVSGTTTLPPDAYAAAARAAFAPGQRLASIKLPGEQGGPVIAATGATPTRVQDPAPRTNIYLDPPTARVLDVASSRAGPVMVMHRIHGTFLIPGTGRAIVGWIGVAMLISSLSGLWLWWPTVGRLARGLRWRRHRNFDTNLHHLTGFWIALPLFVLSLTGAWISFPGFFGPLVGENGRPMGFGPVRAAMARAQPLAATATPLPVAVARAVALVPGRPIQVSWPTDYKAQWQIVVAPARGKPLTIAVADSTGIASIAPDMDRGQASIARLMRRIHDGTGMGPVWQTILFLTGLIPALLAVTGIIMWWRARGWKREFAARKLRKPATD